MVLRTEQPRERGSAMKNTKTYPGAYVKMIDVMEIIAAYAKAEHQIEACWDDEEQRAIERKDYEAAAEAHRFAMSHFTTAFNVEHLARKLEDSLTRHYFDGGRHIELDMIE